MGVNSLLVYCCAAVVFGACGARNAQRPLASLRAPCPESKTWSGAACVDWGLGAVTVAKGETQLEEGDLSAAISSFASAVAQGPHSYPNHVRLFKQLGIATAYKDDVSAASKAFRTLLLLDPGHLLSYNTSPSATLKFEQVRKQVAREPRPSLEVRWPVSTDVNRPIAITVEVLADPSGMMKAATLYVRDGEKSAARATDIVLAEPGARSEITLPPLAGNRPRTLALHLVARDGQGSEVYEWASEAQPRVLQVGYIPPTPLRKKWWFWAAIGGVVAVGAGTTAYLLTREPAENLPPGPFNPM